MCCLERRACPGNSPVTDSKHSWVCVNFTSSKPRGLRGGQCLFPMRKQSGSLTWLPEDLEQGSLDPSLEPFAAHLSTCPGVCPVLGSSSPRKALILPLPPASPASTGLSTHVYVFLFSFFLHKLTATGRFHDQHFLELIPYQYTAS